MSSRWQIGVKKFLSACETTRRVSPGDRALRGVFRGLEISPLPPLPSPGESLARFPISSAKTFPVAIKTGNKEANESTCAFRFAAVQAASKTLMDSLNEIYESQWTGHDLLYVQAQNLDMLWQDFTHKLADQVLVPLNTYQSQFPEMRVRPVQPPMVATKRFINNILFLRFVIKSKIINRNYISI